MISGGLIGVGQPSGVGIPPASTGLEQAPAAQTQPAPLATFEAGKTSIVAPIGEVPVGRADLQTLIDAQERMQGADHDFQLAQLGRQSQLQEDLSNKNLWGQLGTNFFNWATSLFQQIFGYAGFTRQKEAEEEIARTWAGASREIASFQKDLGIEGTKAAVVINADTNDYKREHDQIIANTTVEKHEMTLQHQKEMAALGLVPRDNYHLGRTVES